LSNSNRGLYYICKIPSQPIWLNYTQQHTIPTDQLIGLVNGARHEVEYKIGQGRGDDQIGPPGGRYSYSTGDYALYAKDFYAHTPLTWSLLLVAIELVGYCGVGKGGSREMETDVFDGRVWFANMDVKRQRAVDMV